MVQPVSEMKAGCGGKKQAEMKPKIRIFHIVAPEVIETNVENFREIVQRLTGKSEEDKRKRAPETTIREKRSIDKYLVQPPEKKVKLEEEEEPDLGCVDNSQPPGEFYLFDALQELCEMPPIPLDSLYGDIFSEELLCV